MLTEKQEQFCEYIALYGFRPNEAAQMAGYGCKYRSGFYNVASRLLNCDEVNERIDELQHEYFDVDAVRTSIIRYHQQALVFQPSEIVHAEEYTKVNGEPGIRIRVKPYSCWSEIAKRMFDHFDSRGIPVFRDKNDSVKELSRIFGLYRDNAVSQTEDTLSVLAGAGLLPTQRMIRETCAQGKADFDGAALDEAFEEEYNKEAEAKAEKA